MLSRVFLTMNISVVMVSPKCIFGKLPYIMDVNIAVSSFRIAVELENWKYLKMQEIVQNVP